MHYYVNHQAINDLFAPVEMEKNPLGRAEVLLNVSDEFTNRLLKEYEQTAWELKHKLQWNTGQISDLLNISERKVKMLIRWYSERTGEWNPLAKPRAQNVVDISEFVRQRASDKSRPRSAAPIHDADELEHLEGLDSEELANRIHEHLNDCVLSPDDI